MLISYLWLQKYFDKKLPSPERVADALTFHAFEIESLEKKDNDTIIDVKVLPNRTHDALSHLGIAKEISAILNIPLKKTSAIKLPKVSPRAPKVKLEIKEKKACPRFTLLVIDGVKVGPSPKWLKDQLGVLGQRSINNIVDATNYVMFQLGQPLHAYDYHKLEDATIRVRYAREGEQVTTLDKKEVILQADDLVIAGTRSIYGIAGIKGGMIPEVSSDSKTIVLEAANFAPEMIRKTAQRIGIRTDAAKRFESGLTSELAHIALSEVASLIIKIAAQKEIHIGKREDIYSKKEVRRVVRISRNQANSIIGARLKDIEISSVWKRLGFPHKTIKQNDDTVFVVTVPFERLDISVKEDLAEEIGRIVGFAGLEGTLPTEPLVQIESNPYWKVKDVIREVMLAAGHSEVYTYAFMGNGEIEVANPIASDKKYLRNNLATGLKSALAENLKYFPHARMFEFGHIFGRDQGKINESQSFAALIGFRKRKEVEQKQDFFELKGVLEMIMGELKIPDVHFVDAGGELVASVLSGKQVLGYMFINGFELDLDKLVSLAQTQVVFTPPSKFPSIERDVSIFVPVKTQVKQVEDIIRREAGALVRQVSLFDIYETAEQKSFAFRMVLQSDERTLSDQEANDLYDNVVSALEAKDTNWKVRK
jgi:phenylalanyl-tRNA synthetase beta chain